MTVDRESLYKEVWEEPMTKGAKRYEVSSSFLARVCERLNVPRPPRGYWAKLRHGIKVEQPPLPEPQPGDDLEWSRGSYLAPRSLPTPKSTRVSRTRKKGERPAVHPLVEASREHFKKVRTSSYGDDKHYLRPYKRNIVDVYVSRDALSRALDVASDLFLTLEDKGLRVLMAPANVRYQHVEVDYREGGKRPEYARRAWSPGRLTVTHVGDLVIALTLFEVAEEVTVRYDSKLSDYVRITEAPKKRTRYDSRSWTTTKWLPSGRLGLHAFAPYPGVQWEQYWHEKRAGSFPSLFGRIASGIKKAAPKIVELIEQAEREAEERRRKWDLQQREWEKKEEERNAREREAQNEKDILKTIEGWRLARDVRAYVEQVKALVRDEDLRIAQGGPLEEELNWALTYANRVDPLTRLKDDIAKVKAESALELRRCSISLQNAVFCTSSD